MPRGLWILNPGLPKQDPWKYTAYNYNNNNNNNNKIMKNYILLVLHD